MYWSVSSSRSGCTGRNGWSPTSRWPKCCTKTSSSATWNWKGWSLLAWTSTWKLMSSTIEHSDTYRGWHVKSRSLYAITMIPKSIQHFGCGSPQRHLLDLHVKRQKPLLFVGVAGAVRWVSWQLDGWVVPFFFLQVLDVLWSKFIAIPSCTSPQFVLIPLFSSSFRKRQPYQNHTLDRQITSTGTAKTTIVKDYLAEATWTCLMLVGKRRVLQNYCLSLDSSAWCVYKVLAEVVHCFYELNETAGFSHFDPSRAPEWSVEPLPIWQKRSSLWWTRSSSRGQAGAPWLLWPCWLQLRVPVAWASLSPLPQHLRTWGQPNHGMEKDPRSSRNLTPSRGPMSTLETKLEMMWWSRSRSFRRFTRPRKRKSIPSPVT